MNNYQLIAAQQKAAQLLADLNRAQARILELESGFKIMEHDKPEGEYMRGFADGVAHVLAHIDSK